MYALLEDGYVFSGPGARAEASLTDVTTGTALLGYSAYAGAGAGPGGGGGGGHAGFHAAAGVEQYNSYGAWLHPPADEPYPVLHAGHVYALFYSYAIFPLATGGGSDDGGATASGFLRLDVSPVSDPTAIPLPPASWAVLAALPLAGAASAARRRV